LEKGAAPVKIAEKLHLSIKTIGTYRERIKGEVGLKNATELVRHAVHWEKTGEEESPAE
jgi:DNA-binding CsgD family transcriptional regulator